MANKNLNPGMNDEQAQRDRNGWETTADIVRGVPQMMHFCDQSGPEVGNPYDTDPMGEEYGAVTFGTEEAGPAPGPGRVAPMGPAPQTKTVYAKE